MWAFFSWLHWWDGAGVAVDSTPRRFRSLIAPPLRFTSYAAAPVRFVSRPSQ